MKSKFLGVNDKRKKNLFFFCFFFVLSLEKLKVSAEISKTAFF